MSEELNTVDRNVVFLSDVGGLGVISNGYIFTASHCLKATFDGGLTLGDSQLQKCQTSDGIEFMADILFIDGVSDLAVLCSPDNQTHPKLAIAFDKIVDDRGIELFRGTLPIGDDSPVAVRIRNKIDSGWVNGVITQQFDHSIFIEAESEVYGGASGGPILEASSGNLIAITSMFSVAESSEGIQPLLSRSLPVWLAEQLYGSN